MSILTTLLPLSDAHLTEVAQASVRTTFVISLGWFIFGLVVLLGMLLSLRSCFARWRRVTDARRADLTNRLFYAKKDLEDVKVARKQAIKDRKWFNPILTDYTPLREASTQVTHYEILLEKPDCTVRQGLYCVGVLFVTIFTAMHITWIEIAMDSQCFIMQNADTLLR